MGFFKQVNTQASSGPLAPLSQDRIKDALDSLELEWILDEDGDIACGWQDGTFYFLLGGPDDEVLMVRGFWRGTLDEADFQRAALASNEWNSTRTFSRAAARITPEQEVNVLGDLTVDYEYGISDEQLAQHLKCALSTITSLFEFMNESFPEAAAEFAQ